jgi:hypothetical protein
MHKFYKASITKRLIGTAIQHKEPPVQGEIIIKVTDSTTAGDFKIFVVNANDNQHKANLALDGIELLTEDQALKLAKKYQPKRTTTRFNPGTMKEEQITLPACDLKKFYKKKE